MIKELPTQKEQVDKILRAKCLEQTALYKAIAAIKNLEEVQDGWAEPDTLKQTRETLISLKLRYLTVSELIDKLSAQN